MDRPLRAARNWIPVALVAAGAVAAVWTTTLNARLAGSASEPLPVVRSTELTPADLPPFEEQVKTSGVSRLVNPKTEIPVRPRVEVLRYTVQRGDSVFGIAKTFGLEPESILWGNYDTLNDDPDMVQPGLDLNILPVDGVLYRWQEGDTLVSVATTFEVDPREIVDWPGNSIDPAAPEIKEGTVLVVPGGVREFRQWLIPIIARGNAGVGAAFGSGGCSGDFSGGAYGSGAFIWPSANHFLSGNDYWSGHLAIDIALALGDLIWASDSGVVVYAGWSGGGYGNMVMVDHGNGYQTLYAHLNGVTVQCGQSVGQGSGIGYGGSTGNSTGAHLHFEVRSNGGFVNPWYVLP
ncbi:MAG: M23 family metallopeptidase [Chloroflexi bacterium]|nr:M23 family metallopeptidase [Chloroflexota bacterium]